MATEQTTKQYLLGKIGDDSIVYSDNVVTYLKQNGDTETIELPERVKTLDQAYEAICAMYSAWEYWQDCECEELR